MSIKQPSPKKFQTSSVIKFATFCILCGFYFFTEYKLVSYDYYYIGMDIGKYCQCFLSSISLRRSSLSNSPHPWNFTILQGSEFANRQISDFFQILMLLIKKNLSEGDKGL